MSSKLRILGSLSIVLVFCSVGRGQTTTISESAAYNALATSTSGSLLISNSTNTNDQGQCASTSLINSFQYLQRIAPGNYGTNLTGGAGTANAITSRNQLDNSIVTGGSNGDQGDVWNAKLTWFNTHGGTANTTFEGVTVNSSTDADYKVGTGNMAFQQSGTQIWNFLIQQLQKGQDVEIGMFDHMVTLIGVQSTGGTNNIPALAEIVDPNFPSPGGTGQGGMSNGAAGEWVNASYSTFFGLVQLSGFSIGGTGYSNPYIYYAFAESPTAVPEPAALVLLGASAIGLVAACRRRRRRRVDKPAESS
jgi:hypothetical protein